MHPEEIWQDIPGFENCYMISNLGRVRSKSKLKPDLILKPRKQDNGYLFVNLRHKPIRIHKLVAMTFLNKPFESAVVNHKNGIKTDNRVENLEWITQSENIKHSIRLGLSTYYHQQGANNTHAKLTDVQVAEVRRLSEKGVKQKEIRKLYNFVNQSTISRIMNNKTWNSASRSV